MTRNSASLQYALQVHIDSLKNECVETFESTNPFQALAVGDKFAFPRGQVAHWFPETPEAKVAYITDKQHIIQSIQDLQMHIISIALSVARPTAHVKTEA